jgi:LacI family transcriptional regulator
MQKHSLSSIAGELGVSKATVSLVINGYGRKNRISYSLEQRILEYCRRVNYRPNIHARRLNCREVRNVGVLLGRWSAPAEPTPFADENIAKVVGGIATATHAEGYRFTVQLYQAGMDPNLAAEWFSTREIDGLIFYGFEPPRNWTDAMIATNRPIVGVSHQPASGFATVNIDNFKQSYQITEYLIKKSGRRSFLFLKGSSGSYPGEERLRGFLAALDAHKIEIPSQNLLDGHFERDLATGLIEQRLRAGQLTCDAIVAANDYMAIGAVIALKRAGLSVPGQIAVAGADNVQIGQAVIPTLTTYDYLPYEMGKAAFHLLLGHIREKSTRHVNVVLESSLIIREST